MSVVIPARAVDPRRQTRDSGVGHFYDRKLPLRPLLESEVGIPQFYWQVASGTKRAATGEGRQRHPTNTAGLPYTESPPIIHRNSLETKSGMLGEHV